MEKSRRREKLAVSLLFGLLLPCCLAQTTPSNTATRTPTRTPTPSPSPQTERLRVRLSGYPRKHNEGRVELFYKGEWGTICDDDFAIANANVLCRQLGFVEATGWTHSAKYGKGQGKIWLDNVQCNGGERSIDSCKSRGWGNSDCTHDEDAGVVCKDERIPGFVESNVIDAQVDEKQIEEVRLRPVVTTARKKLPITEGVVEVKYKDGWAQICDLRWTIKNTHVICGMLGFPHERKVNKNFYKRLKKRAAEKVSRPKVNVSAGGRQTPKAKANSKTKQSSPGKRLYLERQKNHFHVHSVACAGTEIHLAACPLEFSKPNATSSCEGGMPAVVSCMPGPLFIQNNGLKKKPKISNNVRLKGGAKLGEGRVEVLKGNEWGTVCDDRWSLQSASVVCRELGFGSAKEALTGARMGQGIGPIYMNEVKCVGQERSIWNCPFKNITSEDCQHVEDAAVRCNVPYMGVEHSIRIVGGRTTYEGRVEVQVGSKWGTVCSAGWTTKEAMVVCRQLGLGYSMHAITETWYWDSSNVTEMIMSGVKCTGNEMSLSQCQHHKTVSCQKAAAKFAAGVICSDTASDLVLNASLVQQTVYIEDRPLHMLYCAAEEDCLSKTAAQANWPYGHRRLLRFSSQIHNIGRADFKPKAGRHSWVWHACHGHYHSMDIFTHYDLLSGNGTKVAEGHKASFCLEDTDCQEGVSKRYECANFGNQGITVGCWDLYRHDIDCQWIDITDVKPGNYILQIVINPNYEVAESDFTNNCMKCNCKYDGHRIWLHNCHIGDAFSEEAERRFEKYPGQLNNQIPSINQQ
ncbi:lysyl oxidase homolog 3B isoform X2 [Gymnodraco acuticeps]|uniref:Lysyl oxidase homolog n=1 Tax=Gymnodraco acuticeps TaxID=8218 RepID=A0A6P8VZH1_GYMAC|nr:lysyl oxidase homolog 3B isoform X2 [Gymnodraco acuticeps]